MMSDYILKEMGHMLVYQW